MNNLLFAEGYHKTGGLLRVMKRETEAKVLPAFLNAGRELGYQEIDPNLPNLVG